METISFGGDGIGPDLVPSEELADCAATALEQDGKRILSYGTGAGYTPLRELVAEQHGVHPHRVLITNGWLQGFALIAQGRVAAQNVIVEYPTYDRVQQLLFHSAANLLYFDLHPGGVELAQVEYHLRTNQKPALTYLIPTFHNPTGQTMSEEKRLEVGRMLHRNGTLIIEDDTYGLLRYEGEAVPTVFELSAQTSIYSTSYSATIAPGLRVGVFILPDELSNELATKANSIYITPVLLAQATVFEFQRRGSLEPHLEFLKGALAERRDAMHAALEKHFEGARWLRPEGGIFMMLELPPGSNAQQIVEQAEGVTAPAGIEFGAGPNAIRLNFAAVTPDQIEAGIGRLAASAAVAAANT